MRISFGLTVLALVLASGCAGDDVATVPTTASAPSSTADSAQQPESGDDGAAGSELTLGEESFDLDVQTCSLGPGGGAVGIVAVTSDGGYEFSAGGTAGAVTITLRGVGNPGVWTATGATATIGSGTFGYSGTVAGPAGEEQMSVSVNC